MGTQPPVRGWRAILRVRTQAERGWVDAVRGGEPEPSSAQLAQLSLPRGRRRVGGRNYSAPHHYSVGYKLWAGCGVKFNHPLCMTTYPRQCHESCLLVPKGPQIGQMAITVALSGRINSRYRSRNLCLSQPIPPTETLPLNPLFRLRLQSSRLDSENLPLPTTA